MNEILKEQTIDYILGNYPNMNSLINASETELNMVPGLTRPKAKQFYAFLQLSRQLLNSGEKSVKITSPSDIYNNMKEIALFEEERFFVILLDTKNKVITHVEVSKGTLNAAIVHPREVFSIAVKMRANSIICCHNHPSSDTTPSNEDLKITERLKDAGELLGIKLVDHVIISSNGFYSFKENGTL